MMTQLIDKTRLNLEIMAHAPWLPCEDDFLDENTPDAGEPDYVALAVRLKRPVGGVVDRVNERRWAKKQRKPAEPRTWTDRMDAMLTAEAAKARAESRPPRWLEIGLTLGMTKEAVKGRVRRLRDKGVIPR